MKGTGTQISEQKNIWVLQQWIVVGTSKSTRTYNSVIQSRVATLTSIIHSHELTATLLQSAFKVIIKENVKPVQLIPAYEKGE